MSKSYDLFMLVFYMNKKLDGTWGIAYGKNPYEIGQG